jgi:hypothetical protein
MNNREQRAIRFFDAKFSVFVFLFFIIFHILNGVADLYIDNHYELQYREITDNLTNTTAIIIGSSHGVRGINPLYLDDEHYTFYNFSYNGSNPEFYLKWYNDLLRKYYPRPRLVLYEVDWFMFDESWLWRKFNHDTEYFPFRLFLKTLLLSPDRQISFTNRFPLIKEKDRIRDKLFREDWEALANPLTKYYRGYIPRHQERNLEPKTIMTTRNEKQIESFYKLLESFENDNIDIVFVQSPEYLQGRIAGNGYNDFLWDVSRERNIPFLDYNQVKITSINYDSTCFFDWGHLNEKGAREFSLLLREDLKGILTHQN